jgi:hypothetical protein
MHEHRLGMLVVKMVIINVSVIFFNNTCRWDTLVINMGHHQSSALWRMTQVSFFLSGLYIRSFLTLTLWRMTQSEVRKRFDRFLSDLLRGKKKMGFDVIFWTSVPAITQRNDNIIAQGDWRTLHRR